MMHLRPPVSVAALGQGDAAGCSRASGPQPSAETLDGAQSHQASGLRLAPRRANKPGSGRVPIELSDQSSFAAFDDQPLPSQVNQPLP